MSNYTITEGTNTLTLTLKNNTKYAKKIYNNTAYYNNTTDKMLQARNNGAWNCFSLLTLDQVIIPKSTSFNTDNKIHLIFKDTKGRTSTITIPLLFDDFEEELRKQFNPTFNNNMEYMYGFIKTVLFDIYQDTDVLNKISTYDPDTVTLTIATADTETLPNASVTVTAKDSDNTAIASLPLTILVGETSSTGTTDSNGQYNFTLTTEDCFLVVVTSGETEQYHTATKTIAISTKKPCPECPECPEPVPDIIDTVFTELLPEEWIESFDYEIYDSDGLQNDLRFSLPQAGTPTITVGYNGETYTKTTTTPTAKVTVPVVEDVTEYEITLTDGTNTKTFTLNIKPYIMSIWFNLREYRDTQTPADNEEQQG